MSITQVHDQYEFFESSWAKARDAHAGSEVVRLAGETYLPRPLGMLRTDTYGNEMYDEYKRHARIYDATSRTVEGLLGMAFEKAPDVKAPPLIEPLLSDVNLTGQQYPDFIKEQCEETMLVGRYGVLVDFNVDEQRPAMIGFKAEHIRNWRVSRVGTKNVLTMLLLSETVEDIGDNEWDSHYVTYLRDLRLQGGVYTQQLYKGRAKTENEILQAQEHGMGIYEDESTIFEPEGDLEVPERFGEPLPFIPFQFFSSTHHRAEVRKAILAPLVDIEIDRYYYHTAELERARHLTTSPILIMRDPGDDYREKSITVGAGAAFRFTSESADVYYREFEGKGIGAQERAIEEDVRDMALHGSRLIERQTSANETATAVRERHAGDTSPLKKLVQTAETGHQWLLRVFSWWGDVRQALDNDATTVEIDTDFLAGKLSPQELQALVASWQAGGISHETLLWNIKQGKRLPPDVAVDDEIDRIELETAEFREQNPPLQIVPPQPADDSAA